MSSTNNTEIQNITPEFLSMIKLPDEKSKKIKLSYGTACTGVRPQLPIWLPDWLCFSMFGIKNFGSQSVYTQSEL